MICYANLLIFKYFALEFFFIFFTCDVYEFTHLVKYKFVRHILNPNNVVKGFI